MNFKKIDVKINQEVTVFTRHPLLPTEYIEDISHVMQVKDGMAQLDNGRWFDLDNGREVVRRFRSYTNNTSNPYDKGELTPYYHSWARPTEAADYVKRRAQKLRHDMATLMQQVSAGARNKNRWGVEELAEVTHLLRKVDTACIAANAKVKQQDEQQDEENKACKT